MENNVLICPKCGCEIETTDCVNTFIHANGIDEKCIGYCPECEINYHWTERYKFMGIKDLEEYKTC